MTRHCDDFIDDPSTPEPLRAFLDFHRAPAIAQQGKTRPTLFAKHNGQIVRVVMASRLGDVGITKELDRTHGYEARVAVQELTDFTDTMSAIQ